MKPIQTSIDSITEIVTKGTTPTSIGYSFVDRGIPFLRVNNIQDGKLVKDDILFINSDTDNALSRSRIKPRDVLISIAGTIGRTAVVPINETAMNCNQAVAIIRLLDQADPYYVNYWLQTEDASRQIAGSKVTATISNLSLGCIKNLRIPLPPIAEQRRIAAILDKADAVRRKRKEAIALTEELLRSAFLDMFGDPVTNPKGWEVKPLEKTFERKPQIGTAKPAHSDGKYLIIRVGEVGNQNIELNKCGSITLDGNDLERALCQPGDFFLVRAIGSESHLGKASILQETSETVVFDSHVMRLRFTPAAINPIFFLQWLRTKGGRTRFMKEAGRTAVQFNVNATQMSRVKIPCPPIEEQEKFVDLYQRVKRNKLNFEKSYQRSEDCFNSLLQRAFRGDL